MTRRATAGLVLGLAVFGVSWGSILVRLCDGADPLAIAFWRLAIAAALVAPWAVGSGRPRADRRTVLAGAVAGLFLAVHFATWIQSLAWTTVASSVILVSTAPVFTALLSPWVLGERPGRRAWGAVGLTLVGSAILARGDLDLGPRALAGDALAVVGALAVSLYMMVGRRVRDRIGFAPYLGLVYGTGAAVLLVLALALDVRLSGWAAPTWGWLALLAIGPNLLGHGLLNWSVRRLRALTVQTAVLGEPVLATMYAAALLGERPALAFYAGATLIVVGVVLAAREETARGPSRGLESTG